MILRRISRFLLGWGQAEQVCRSHTLIGALECEAHERLICHLARSKTRVSSAAKSAARNQTTRYLCLMLSCMLFIMNLIELVKVASVCFGRHLRGAQQAISTRERNMAKGTGCKHTLGTMAALVCRIRSQSTPLKKGWDLMPSNVRRFGASQISLRIRSSA